MALQWSPEYERGFITAYHAEVGWFHRPRSYSIYLESRGWGRPPVWRAYSPDPHRSASLGVYDEAHDAKARCQRDADEQIEKMQAADESAYRRRGR